MARQGIEIQRPEGVIKNTYTLEFLNFPELDRYTEGDLEQGIIDNLQSFLLEFGKGFKVFCLNWFEKEFCEAWRYWSDDNAPIGIILNKNKDELLIEYATYGMDSNLFVAKYELYLPNRKDLERLVANILNNDE